MKRATIGVVLLLLGSIVMSGCAKTPMGRSLGANTPEHVGPRPMAYEESIHKYLDGYLKDPYSARIKIGEPVSTHCSLGIFGHHWGWAVPTIVNAKNSYGGYTGEQLYVFWVTSAGRLQKLSFDMKRCPGNL